MLQRPGVSVRKSQARKRKSSSSWKLAILTELEPSAGFGRTDSRNLKLHQGRRRDVTPGLCPRALQLQQQLLWSCSPDMANAASLMTQGFDERRRRWPTARRHRSRNIAPFEQALHERDDLRCGAQIDATAGRAMNNRNRHSTSKEPQASSLTTSGTKKGAAPQSNLRPGSVASSVQLCGRIYPVYSHRLYALSSKVTAGNPDQQRAWIRRTVASLLRLSLSSFATQRSGRSQRRANSDAGIPCVRLW